MRVALSTTLFLVLILHSHAAHEDDTDNSEEARLKSNIVSDIIHKVTNLTTNAFAKVRPQEKEKMLTKIRDKLMKASTFTGPNAKKYVDLVMEGVEVIATDDTKPDDGRRVATRIPQINTKLQRKLKNTISKARPSENDKSIKSKLVRSIAKKIEILTKVAFYKAKTPEEKEKIIKNIKNRVIEAAKKHKVMIRSQNHGMKPYGELVVEGVELTLRKEFNNSTDKRTGIEVEDSQNALFRSNNNKIEETAVNENVKPDEALGGNELDLCDCDCVIEKTCAKITALNTFTCRQDKSAIPLEKLCDGIPHCTDQSDEEQCAKNAIIKLQHASSLMSDIEALLPRQCLKTTLEDDILTTQNSILDNVLKQQVEFIKKHDPTKNPQFVKFNNNEIKGVVNDIGRIVSTVGLSLEGAFCVHEKDENVFSRRALTVIDEDLDDLMEDKSWAPPICVCKDEFCVKSNCTPSCQRTCWQRYSLGQLVCAAISGKATVSLEFICDGKVDCYDESDEMGCSAGKNADKFEARNIYNIILKVLSSKVALEEFHPVLNKLNALQDSVLKLQELSTKDKTDLHLVKILRDKCFADLISIYDEVLNNSDDIGKVNELYLLLISLNENLVSALKHSQTGNDKVVVTHDCLCREESCATTPCSPTCLRACSVNPKLTRYSCNSNSNTIIHIDNICNGKPDCPRSDDEENCKDEVCRNHHLVLLRNAIQNTYFKEGLIADILKAWKTKTIATLLVLEKRGRTTRRVLQKVVGEVLHDLTMAYASLGEFRRTMSKQTVGEFSVVAHRVQEILRTCSK